jgi:hypothetical protein
MVIIVFFFSFCGFSRIGFFDEGKEIFGRLSPEKDFKI